MTNEYLVDVDSKEREHEAILRLFDLPFIYSEFFGALGLNPSSSWYLLEIREHYFNGSLTGEVDILAGRLELDYDKINGEKSTKYLIGVEAKCAYLHPQATQISLEFRGIYLTQPTPRYCGLHIVSNVVGGIWTACCIRR